MSFTAEENATLLLDTVPRVMRSIRTEMRALAQGKFTVPQFRILNRLRRQPLTNRDLALWMGVAPPTMSRMIETLESKKLIRRERQANDLRAQTLTLTELGSRETDSIRRSARANFAAKLKGLPGERVDDLTAGLKVLESLFQ